MRYFTNQALDNNKVMPNKNLWKTRLYIPNRIAKRISKRRLSNWQQKIDWDKLHALLYLRTKYENENRSEEAAVVSKLILVSKPIHEEKADEIREYDGF